MKTTDLNVLIKEITRVIVKEFISLSSSDKAAIGKSMGDTTETDPSIPTKDAMTPAEKSTAERKEREAKRKDLASKKLELKAAIEKQKSDKAAVLTNTKKIPDMKRGIDAVKKSGL